MSDVEVNKCQVRMVTYSTYT